MRNTFRLLLISGLLMAAPALAQDESVESIVVTGSRAEMGTVPHAEYVRRADHLITEIRVVCDTRDADRRLQELRQTLDNILRAAAKDHSVSLSVERDGKLRRFDSALRDSVITSGPRVDTSRAIITIKTDITASDSFDSATKRIKDFIKRVPVVGRSEILGDEAWEIAVVNPQQYHDRVIAKVAEEAKAIAAQFGSDYGVTAEGLQRPVVWYRKGQLELALYIPFEMKIAPK